MLPPTPRQSDEFHYLLFRNGGIDAPAVRREIAVLINKWDSSVEVAMEVSLSHQAQATLHDTISSLGNDAIKCIY